MNSVAEERTLAEDHAERARICRDAHAVCVSADVEHRDVAGTRRGRIDDAASTGVYAVRPDQEIPLSLGTVLEPRHNDPLRRDLGIDEPLVVLAAGAAADCLVAQRSVEVGPLEGLDDCAILQGTSVGNVAEVLAGPTLDRHARRGEAL